jgi:hypothetical protein
MEPLIRVGLMALAVAGLCGTSSQRAAAQVPDKNRRKKVTWNDRRQKLAFAA